MIQLFEKVTVRVFNPNSEIRVFVVFIDLHCYLLPYRILLCIVSFLICDRF